jgi:hypothetical protein
MSENPITLSDIKAYVDLFGEPAFGVRNFTTMMSKMDARFLEVKNRK